jgi:hypothetical protein
VGVPSRLCLEPKEASEQKNIGSYRSEQDFVPSKYSEE